MSDEKIKRGLSPIVPPPADAPMLTNTSDMYFAINANEQIDGGDGNDLIFGGQAAKDNEWRVAA